MKLSITGDAYVLTSEIGAEDILLLKKWNPDALKVKDDDGNDKFAISFLAGRPCISSRGVTFGGKTHDDNGFATVTGMFPAGTTNVKDYLVTIVAPTVAYLKQLEESVPQAAAKVRAEHDALVASITVG